jgi:hypothetical protein
MISVERAKTIYGTPYSIVKEETPKVTLAELNSYDIQHPNSKPKQASSEPNFTPVAPNFTPVTKKAYPVKTTDKKAGAKTVRVKGPVEISGATEVTKLTVIEEDDNVEDPPAQQKILKMFNTVNQSGYQTKKEFETYPTEGYSVPKTLQKKGGPVKIDNDSINQFKFKYRSGLQPDSIKNPPLEDLFVLMDSENLYRIKNKRLDGAYNSSGGHSGYRKREIEQNYYS